MPDLSVEQFQKLSRHIYQRLGLHFDDKKIYFVKTRVAKRMAALGIVDANDYIFRLHYADPQGLEMQSLANLITTNETYMFREYEQLQAFANHSCQKCFPLNRTPAIEPCASGARVVPRERKPITWP